ncbi:MAG: hypothetical protein R3E48_12140 [Burkholderiaceae bacterium]
MYREQSTRYRWTIGLGGFSLALGAILLVLWIPVDVETGVVETIRRQTTIGDAMAPTVVAWALVLIGLALGWEGLIERRRARDARHADEPRRAATGIDADNLRYLLILALTLTTSLLLIRHLGDAAVALANLFGAQFDGYRDLRATRPWLYVGFFGGGFTMVFTLMCVASRRVGWQMAVLAAIAVAVMALAFDLPFDKLLLPPNGDV